MTEKRKIVIPPDWTKQRDAHIRATARSHRDSIERVADRLIAAAVAGDVIQTIKERDALAALAEERMNHDQERAYDLAISHAEESPR